MKKQTLVLIPTTVVIVAGLGAGSFWFYNHSQKNQPQLGEYNSSLASAEGATSGNSATTGSSASQVGVSTVSNANSMGQLNSNQSGQPASVTSNTSGQSTVDSDSTSSSSSSQSAQLAHLLDPSTFSQYNVPKYIDGTTASYVDLQTGTGASLVAGDTAAVYYKGWLTNGTLFDETKDNSSGQMQPFDFAYGTSPSQVITGWQEGLSGMKVGGVRLLIIPPATGYGASGNASIPGNSVLIFQVQLAAVQQ